MPADDVAPETPPLVAAATEAFTRAHEANIATSMAARDENLTKWLEAFESEHAGVLQTVLTEILAHPDMPPMVRDVMGDITNPAHQTQVLLGMFSVGAIVMQFVGAAIAPEVQAVSNVAWAQNPDMPLSPADLALGVVRGHVDPGDAASEAKKSGIDADKFNTLYLNTGNPPGSAALAEALRRGFIDADQFTKGIKQGDVRDEWRDTLYQLRYGPVPIGELLAAAVQGHLPLTEAATRLGYAGLNPDDFEWLYETSGNPLPVGEMEMLVNRGEATIDQLETAIRESRVKDKYIPLAVLLKRKIPPMRSVVAAIHQGVLSPADGLAKLMNLGYNAEDAAIFVKEASSLKHSTTKQLAQSQVHALYTQRLITAAAARTMLGNLGYDATEVGFIMALADNERAVKAQTTAVTRVHARYISFRIDRNFALTSLDKIGVDPQGRDDLISTWDDERAANTPLLTVADVRGLAHRKLIDQTEFRNRLLILGYAAADVPLQWHLSWPPTQSAPEWKL